MANTEPFSEAEMLVIRRAQVSFAYFLKEIYPRSFDGLTFRSADGSRHPFALGHIHYLWAHIAQIYPRICILAPRLHLKSTILNHAFCFWQLFKAGEFVDGIIFSFSQPRAWEHLAKLKRYISRNPYTRFWQDLKPRSVGVHYRIGFGDGDEWEGIVDAAGIFTAQRGRHPKFLVADDILSDFANKLDSSQMKRIDDIFLQTVSSLPEIDEPLIVVGTPQSYDDTLFKLRYNPEYYWGRFPAEKRMMPTVPSSSKETLWPQKYDWNRLKKIERAVKPTAYQVEYLLVPFLAANAYIPQEAWEMCVDSSLDPYPLDRPFPNPDGLPVYFGMDVGQEVHPSHLSVAVEMPDRTLVELHQKFLDHTAYDQQTLYVNKVVSHFGVQRGYYDATRAELYDRGMNKRIIPKKFTRQMKGRSALILERRVFAGPDEPGLVLLKDDRAMKSRIAVDKELKATELDGGHGDAFWSTALMCMAAEDGPGISLIDENVNSWMSNANRPHLSGFVR